VTVRNLLTAKYPTIEREQFSPLTDADVAKAFPKIEFCLLRFRLRPAHAEPAKITWSRGVVCVLEGEHVTTIRDKDALKKFFIDQLPAAARDEHKVAAVKAW